MTNKQFMFEPSNNGGWNLVSYENNKRSYYGHYASYDEALERYFKIRDHDRIQINNNLFLERVS